MPEYSPKLGKMGVSTTTIVLIVILILIVLFVVFGCGVSCITPAMPIREGYERSELGNDCFGLQRTPVDYAQKYPNGWQRNPHWKARPQVEYQPLDYGPIDLWPRFPVGVALPSIRVFLCIIYRGTLKSKAIISKFRTFIPFPYRHSRCDA